MGYVGGGVVDDSGSDGVVLGTDINDLSRKIDRLDGHLGHDWVRCGVYKIATLTPKTVVQVAVVAEITA